MEQTIIFCPGFKDWNKSLVSMCQQCARQQDEEELDDPDAEFFLRCPNDSIVECLKFIDKV